MNWTLAIALGCTLPLAGVSRALWAEEAGQPLHARVDALIAAKAGDRKMSPPAEDAEFLRRAWLDFEGGIPTAAEARAFLADTAPHKREALIGKLIAAPRFAERMAEAFNVMLMERRGENAEWREWLVESFQANKPWDAMVREILAPDFKDDQQRGAGWFMVRRLEKVGQQDTDYPGLTRDVGRMFMGVDLQCCQCHKHLTVDEYKQADFNGLFMVYQNLKLQTGDKERKSSWLSEGLIKAKYEFTSVLNGKKGETGPRVPFGPEVAIPAGEEDDLWMVKPDRKKKEMGVPKFSPLRELAQRLATAENPRFARNIANRVWFLLMGRGLVEPLDLNHSSNPATHPELLDLLTKELVAHQFDLRWLIQELALTQTYARSSLLPEQADAGAAAEESAMYLTAAERRLSAEQLARSFLTATGERDCLTRKPKEKTADDSVKYSVADMEKAFEAALANAAKEPELRVNPTLRSSLFFRNSEQVRWALQPHPGNLVERLATITDNNALADELFLTVLTRHPAPEESAAFGTWMEKHGSDRAGALSDFAWALFSSTEWLANH